ncbi:clathrin interactor EPSIN 2 isoform X1 [Prunus yedoensis var. nudiflora]|uniref:Clathrin interactor EPSIN 2 isoform X1 n=1 Tax=Prunus yedoensis var. nudiflora TaxID=2094558 RepID=A0A314XG92_PRUYE|nr:clathrin interactor EPSIN 2 isoform X1 [Prunus yedoensis var. nudiflora]
MKKVFDQTVRDIKREVNKKVLKVPGIEQKVLDATSNEPWGPHGSLLADIAQATRNYHEYQMIMSVIWKRLSDTGKNWRHVYKALIVLEYMVAHGSERVIDDIKEHAYQISTLSDFQYIDSSGRDQGSNVRKKSQSLVALVNDKERIIEVRQKAAANRDKFRNTSSPGGMYRPGSYSSTGGYGDKYDDDRYEGRYGGRDEDRNGSGYGRERELGYRDDDREGFRDDDYRGRSRSVDDYHDSRSRSSDRERERSLDDDGQYSSRGSGARADDQSQDGRLSRKFSEQNIGAPPSYEEVVSESRSPVHSERGGETPTASAPRASSPPTSTNPGQATSAQVASASPVKQEVEPSDEFFDPRGSVSGVPFGSVSAAAQTAQAASAAPATSNNVEMDLLGSLSDSFSSNALAIVPTTSPTTTFEPDAHANSGSATTFVATPSALML